MDTTLVELADKAGVTLFDYQVEFLEAASQLTAPQRVCLYYRTGAGKSFTSLAAMALWGYDTVVVISPPATNVQWNKLAKKLGMNLILMSHAKFRMATTKLSRHYPVIADEMHLFGGQQGKGWNKLDTLARHLNAPMILASATPNYNDAERVYCIQHILDPHSCKGGYIQFLYQNCVTEMNPFAMMPNVLGFQKYNDAAEYLADLEGVFYLPDTRKITIQDIEYKVSLPDELFTHSYNRRRKRMVASIIEMRHTVRYQGLVAETGFLNGNVNFEIQKILATSGPLMIYSDHSTIAEAISRTLNRDGVKHVLVTGSTSETMKRQVILETIAGSHQVLIGTATLATGTDGLDRVFDTLLIVDDTDDKALRRQLIGRILPRGIMSSSVSKQIFRLVPVS